MNCMLPEDPNHVLRLAQEAFRVDDAPAVRRLLDEYPTLRSRINEPIGDFDSPAITRVRSREMLDALLDAGADINARSQWWAGGFGLLDNASPELAAYAMERGATVTAHAAARLGMLDKLRALIDGDPSLVHARGGDGQTPLHFASTVEIAEYLLDRGADIDARDIDHESTPGQYMLGKRSEIARYLVSRGCKTDILMAAALGDLDLIRRHLDANSDAIRMRVSDEYFPMVGGRNGGTIYQWELGWYVSAVQVARAFRHSESFDLLTQRCPADEELLNACWLHDGAMVRSLIAQQPDLVAQLTPAGRRQLGHAARNNDSTAAHLMLEAGLPVDTYSQHHATPLHWAAWHGNVKLVRSILRRKPPIDDLIKDSSNDFKGTPVDWAVHGSANGWDRRNGDYTATLDALFDAGAPLPDRLGGTEAVQGVLRRHGVE
jgi:ankyrin repeat protein